VTFETASGPLHVVREGGRLAMSLPAYSSAPVESRALAEVLGVQPREVRISASSVRKLLVVVEDEAMVRAVAPRAHAMLAAANPHDVKGVIVTAPGTDRDFVSRYFAPWLGIDEDPVTGSAHCVLATYWAERLGRTTMHARQVSRRGGDLDVTLEGNRVVLGGACTIVARGVLLA
jgi:PhzF family phenazine biosynthesis protein